MRNALIAAAVTVVLAACRTAAPVPDAAPQREAFVSAFNRGDVAALRELYASDAVLLAFTGQAVTSVEMITAGLARASAAFDLDLEPLRTRVDGELLYEAGTWRHREKGTATVRDTGTYVWVWRKAADGRWRIDLHAVNRKPPAPR